MTQEPEEIVARGMDGNVSWLVLDNYRRGGEDLARLMTVRAMMEPRDFWFEGLSSGFDPSAWMQAPRDAAIALTEDANRRGLVFHPGGMPQAEVEPSEAFALFISRFKPDARFYVTNLVAGMTLTEPTPDQIDILAQLAQFDGKSGLKRYTAPSTRAIMDSALGVVDAENAGIFCIEDTD
ncbi:hypothetical protein [Maricaulis sp.]|uniref:hypothetical protein n=1 Tax=Maricaulis sp. TaxID=1486257 RepID=UPI00262AEB4B|nr:hypothetical protein [Maricaulis sp.]